MATAFQVNAFQNNAFQILIEFEAEIDLTFSLTSNLTIVVEMDADFDLITDLEVAAADLIDYGRMSARPSLTFGIAADMTIVEQLAAVWNITFNAFVDEGILRDEVVLVAEAMNPLTVVISTPGVEAVTLVAEALNPVTATVWGIPADAVIPEPASIEPDSVTLVRI